MRSFLISRKTDLPRVKLVAHTLLDMQIQKTAFSPATASHPFMNSGISALRNEDSILSSGYAIYISAVNFLSGLERRWRG